MNVSLSGSRSLAFNKLFLEIKMINCIHFHFLSLQATFGYQEYFMAVPKNFSMTKLTSGSVWRLMWHLATTK